jgi:atypical dual specificity phosphatase
MLENKMDVNILIHCHKGVSRSASFVIALLMKRKNLDLITAFKMVKDKRLVINPNEGFFTVLQDY